MKKIFSILSLVLFMNEATFAVFCTCDKETATDTQVEKTKTMITKKRNKIKEVLDDYKEALEDKRDTMKDLLKTMREIEYMMKKNQIERKKILKLWDNVNQTETIEIKGLK